jgi:hypothetical protein
MAIPNLIVDFLEVYKYLMHFLIVAYMLSSWSLWLQPTLIISNNFFYIGINLDVGKLFM